MDPVEERLQALLHEYTPQPPVLIDPAAVMRAAGAGIGPGPLVAVAAVVAVLAVVAGLLLGNVGHDTSAPPVGATSTSVPAPTSSASPSTTASTTTSSSGSSGPSAVPGPPDGPVPAGFTPSSVTFGSPTTGWVLGTAPCRTPPCTSLLRTRDGGATWAGIPAPRSALGAGGGDTGVSAVRFAGNAVDGWAFGPDLWATHDGGATWTKLPAPGDGGVASLETSGGIAIATVVTRDTGAVSVWGTRTGSDAWSKLTGPLGSGGTRSDLAMTGADWFVVAGTAYHGTGLTTPTSLPQPCSSGLAPTSVATPRPVDVDVLCVGGAAAGSSLQQLVGSTDGGRTWHASGAPAPTQNAFSISDNGAGVLLTARTGGASVLTRSSDFGHTSATVLSDGGGGTPWGDMGFTTTTQAVAVLSGRALYLSHDAGATWSTVGFGSG